MATDFEPIWTALLGRIESRVSGFKTITRKPKQQYGVEQYPVLEFVELDEDPTQEGAEPPQHKATATLGIVCRVTENDDSPFTQVNALLYALRTALERQATDHEDGTGVLGHYTNLGARVESLSIGRVEKRWGEGVSEVWVKVPIEVTTY